MTKTDLYVGLVCVDVNTLEKHTILHIATEGTGDSLAWTNPDGTEAGGSAEEFCTTHVAMPGHVGLTHEGGRGGVDSPHFKETAARVAQRGADIKARDERLALEAEETAKAALAAQAEKETSPE
jgi:hypothetical protein